MAKITKSILPMNTDANNAVTVKITGAVTEIKNMVRSNIECPILKIDADNYVLRETGEIMPFKKTAIRSESPESVKQSLHHLRDILNTNCSNTSNCAWLTLTYAENMTNTKQLYEDFRRFHQRFLYHCKKEYNTKYEYIVCCEPQGRGAWHMHIVLIFEKKAPFIPNDIIAQLWKNGFTKIKKLKNIDNVGLYLTAYLTDMNIDTAIQGGLPHLKGKPILTKGDKSYIKGSRLHLYPKGFRLYRTSRGIKQPKIFKCAEKVAQKMVANQMLTYEKTIDITTNDGSFINKIHYRQYNKNRKG